LLVVKLVQCQVVFDCSFHVVTHYHEWSFLALFLTCVTLVDVSSHMVTLSHCWSRFVTVALYTLSRFVTSSRFVTRCELSLLAFFFTSVTC
jgi:hypothetical protein